MPLVKRGASARKVLTVHASTLEEVALHPIASLVPFNYTLALAGDSIHANMIIDMERGTVPMIASYAERGGHADETIDGRRIACSV